MRRFEGRVAVITGIASGIGRATAELLGGRGCDLALVDVNDAGMRATAERVRSAGSKVSCHLADVSDRTRMQALPEEVIREHGHVHILINNAGVLVNGSFEEQTIENLEWILGINFWGVVYGCKFFLPYLKEEDEGHIVNLSSMYAFIGLPTIGAYCATKSAVRAVSEALRGELAATNVGVTSVHPGIMRTNLVRAGHFLDEELKQRTAGRVDRLAPSPERAARKIVRAIERNKVRVTIGPDGHLVEWATRLFPVFTQKLVAWRYRRRSTPRGGS